jgi:recombination protein RecT
MTPTKEQTVNTFKHQLSLYEKNVLTNLLEEHNITPQKFVQVVLTEVKKNDKLVQALMENPASMYASILSGAEIGLMPSEMIGDFYLIPRNLKQDNGTYKMTVCPLIGYKGLVSILLRSGDITRIHTEVVYEGDEFEAIYGIEPTINHKPNFNAIRTAEKIKYAYAVAKNKNGEYQFAVMTRKEIEVIRDMPKYKNDLYFNDAKGNNRWMERKAALIQLSKMLPKDYYAKKAISMDSQLEGGALLTMDEDNKVKIISPNPVRQKNKVYGTLLNIEDDTKS